MRLTILVLLSAVCGCARGDRTPDTGQKSAAVAAADTSGPEWPLWQFGEASVRTDSLPPEADSLRAWGDYHDKERPVAYAVDLTADGKKEFLIRASTQQCGQFGGCPTKLLTRDAGGHLIDVLDGLAQNVMVTNKIANGWPVIWISVGGVDGGVFRMVFREGKYEMSSTLLARRGMGEWTAEQYAADTIWQRIRSVPVP